MGGDGCAGRKYLDGGGRGTESQQWQRQLQLYLPQLDGRWSDQGEVDGFQQHAERIARGTDVQRCRRLRVGGRGFRERLSDARRSGGIPVESDT